MNQTLSTSNPLPLHWVEKLFERMSSMYGTKFSDMWGNSNLAAVKSLWADELGALSREQLAGGVAKLMTLEWPPSLPQFLKLCRPAIDPLQSYYEAVAGIQARDKGEMGIWSSPAVFWAAAGMAYELKSLTYSQARSQWEQALSVEMAKSEHDPIPAPMIAIPHEKKQLTRGEAQAQIEKLGASGLLDPMGDPKDWAGRILKSPKKFPSISEKFAKQALGLEV